MTDKPVKTAVVTGGHPFDVVKFHDLFQELEGVQAYVQHMDEFASSPERERDSYECVVFYAMMRDEPNDEGQPGYVGKPRAALEHLGETGQGILVLHHAILAYAKWPLWSELVGIGDRSFGYHHDQSIRVETADRPHPIIRGVSAWEMIDETYTMADAGADSEVLLTTGHPKSMRTLGWTRTHKDARVFCYQCGHDNQTWENDSFREVLRRGIYWTARRI